METTPRFRFLPQTPVARGVALVCLLLAIAIVGVGLWRGLLSQATPTIGGAFGILVLVGALYVAGILLHVVAF